MNDFHGFAVPYKPYGSDESQEDWHTSQRVQKNSGQKNPHYSLLQEI